MPTFWLILTEWLQRHGKKFSTLRTSLSSGSAPPRSLIETMERDYGVQLMQAWGMTEALGGSAATMKPGAADLPFEQRIDQRMKSGRALFGNRYRIVDDDGNELSHDGVAFGHLRVKSPWVSNGYFKGEGGSAVDEQGWLKTGDLATIDADGYLSLTDRSKDVIKSGGEWISSIELENVASGHPAVLQAAAIGIAHPKWAASPLSGAWRPLPGPAPLPPGRPPCRCAGRAAGAPAARRWSGCLPTPGRARLVGGVGRRRSRPAPRRDLAA